MVTEAKISMVKQLTDELKNNSAFFITEYKGLKVSDLVELRNSLRTFNSSYRVVKNTLFRRALNDIGLKDAGEFFHGPVAVAFVSGDVVPAVKALMDFNKKNSNLKVKAAVVDGKLLSSAEIQTLALLPGRNVLLAMIMRTAMGPVNNFVFILKGQLNKLVWVLNALKDRKS